MANIGDCLVYEDSIELFENLDGAIDAPDDTELGRSYLCTRHAAWRSQSEFLNQLRTTIQERWERIYGSLQSSSDDRYISSESSFSTQID